MSWETIANSPIIENLGVTLLHSVWQIALIAAALFLLLKFTKKSSADFRYLAAVGALCLSFVLPLATFVYHAENRATGAFFKQNFDSLAAPNFDEKARRAEDLSALSNAETISANQETKSVFSSINGWQKVFSGDFFAAALPFLVGLWFAGILFFSLRLCGGVWQLHLFRTRGVSAPDDEWTKRFAKICERLEIKKTVAFLRSERIESPVAAGFFKPVILVPASVFLQISPAELEIIITHELVHIRRCDAPVNFAQSLLEVLFFYHPCVWWMSAIVRREREFAADASVVETFGASRLVYAQALANLETIRQTANQNTPPLAAAANGGNLMQRISKILEKNTEITQSSSAWSAVLALAFISAFVFLVFSPAPASSVNAQTKAKNKKLAIGFVSIPSVDRTAHAPQDADATMRLIIAKLAGHSIPAIGFVQGGMISDGEKLFPARADMVRMWRDAGLEVGVGGFRHVWFYSTPYDEYVANTEKNDAIVRKILAEKNLSPTFFSYPFLNTGKSAEDKNRFENWLGTRGLSSVKYTIDNQEWMYSFAYDAARSNNDVNTMTEIRREFIDYMTKMFDHYEAYAAEMFGRDINQTMVLTPSRLVADSADELFGMIENRGYEFVSMGEAQSDAAYRTDEDFVNTHQRIGKSGISWFERWQMAQNKKLREEPKVSKLVTDAWDQNRSKKSPPPKPPAPPAAPAPPPAAPPAPPAPPVSAAAAEAPAAPNAPRKKS